MTRYLYCDKCKKHKKNVLNQRAECECGGVMHTIEEDTVYCANCGKETDGNEFCSDECEDAYREDEYGEY